MTQKNKTKKLDPKRYMHVTDFAKHCQVTVSSIYAAERANRIEQRPDKKFDIKNKKNAIYCAAAEKRGGRLGRPLIKLDAKQLEATGLDAETVAGMIADENLATELKRIKLKKENLAYLEKAGLVIPTLLVRQSYARINAVLDENFASFAERNAETLRSHSGKTLPLFTDELKKMIERSVKATIRTVLKEIGQVCDDK